MINISQNSFIVGAHFPTKHLPIYVIVLLVGLCFPSYLVHEKSTLTCKRCQNVRWERERESKSEQGRKAKRSEERQKQQEKQKFVGWNVYLSIKWWKLLYIKRNTQNLFLTLSLVLYLSSPTEVFVCVVCSLLFHLSYRFFVELPHSHQHTHKLSQISLHKYSERISSAFYVIVNMVAFSCAILLLQILLVFLLLLFFGFILHYSFVYVSNGMLWYRFRQDSCTFNMLPRFG